MENIDVIKTPWPLWQGVANATVGRHV